MTDPKHALRQHKTKGIVFSHGWPLSADGWDKQTLFFLSQGYRVIAHDRRGHGFPHGMPTTHADTISADLLAFLGG